MGHPYPEVPYLVEGIAYRQAGSQQVGLGAGIQEEGFVEEAAYLEAYLKGNLTYQAAEQSLVEDLEGAAAYQQGIQAAYHPEA